MKVDSTVLFVLEQSIELLGFEWLSTSGFVLLEHFNTCSDDP